MTAHSREFQEIFTTLRPKIVRYLQRLVGEAEAEDLAQLVFVRVEKALPSFAGRSQLSTWVYRIATNCALDWLRSPWSRDTLYGDPVTDLPSGSLNNTNILTAERAHTAEQQFLRKEMSECIRGVVDSLPPDYRTVIVLSELEGFGNEEIARILDVSPGAIKARLHRARARLRQELASQCSLYRDERNELACDPRVGGPK